MAESGASTTSTASSLSYDALRRALDQSAHFNIPKDRIIVGKKSLGDGGFGDVFLGRLRPGDKETTPRSGAEDVAVKVLRASSAKPELERRAFRLAREVLVWSSCKHENILDFIGYHLSEDYETAYLISAYMKNGNAKAYLATTNATIEERFSLLCDTLSGLHYLHNRDPPVVHGDLKAMNVLINNDRRGVLCDFGLAALMQVARTGLTTSDALKGTLRWCSAELFSNPKRTLESDIWAWGCLALEIMTGKYPYHETPTDLLAVVRIAEGVPPELNPSSEDWPDGLFDLVRRCWAAEPKDRVDVCTLVSSLIGTPALEEALQSLEPYSIPGDRLQPGSNRLLSKSGYRTTKVRKLHPPHDSAAELPKEVVVKRFQLGGLGSVSSRTSFFTELARKLLSWLSLEHENVLHFMGYSVCGNFEDVSLVTPYLKNGNVVDYIEQQELYIEDILCLVEGTLNGLQYLHNMDPPVVHGNLKPSNILIDDDGRALLSDYGLADDQTDSSMGGCSERAVRWSSAEVISGELPTMQSDVWSWACVVLQMVTGHHPYSDVKTEGEIRGLLSADEENRRPPRPVSVPAGVPADLIELLQHCWDFDPWGRPDVWSCLNALQSMPEPESDLEETDPEKVLRWLDSWTAKYRYTIPEEASGQDDLRPVRKWSSHAETTMPSADERSWEPSTPPLGETSPELSSGPGAEERQEDPEQETISLLAELTSLHHETVPATEQLVSLHRALVQASIKMTRNKQKMYSILGRCRDICDYILATFETSSTSDESELQLESMLEATEQSRRLIDALERTLLEIARLIPVELETFGPATFASWSQSRATLIRIWNNLGGRPFGAIPDRRVMEFADSTHFDDCAWLSRLLHEVIEPAIALQFPKHEKLPSNVTSVMEGFTVLESAVKRRSVELSQGIVIEMATTLARTLAETTSLEKEVVASPSSEDPALEYESRDRLLGALANTFSDPDQDSKFTPFNLDTARWVDDCIMEYIPTFRKAVQECISRAALGSSVAQEPPPLSSLLGMKVEENIQGHEEGLEGLQTKVVLQTDENADLVPHSTIKVSELTVPEKNATATGSTQVQSTSTPGTSLVDSVAQVQRAISTLRKPITVSREEIGDTLRELHVLLRDDIAPVDRTQSLSSVLPDFERLVQHYPDDFHPDVARILIDVYYDHQIRQGNHSLCLEVALQAAERFRKLSSTNAKFLSSRAEALEKASTSYEILGRYENARACLAEAICVYQQLNSTAGDRQAFQIPLARNLVKYHHVLCRLGRDWDDSDVVNALHEARKIYDSRVWSGESSTQREESEKLGRELANALLRLDLTLIRKGDIVEASEVEDQLMHLYKTLGEEEQAEELKRGGVMALTRTKVDGRVAA